MEQGLIRKSKSFRLPPRGSEEYYENQPGLFHWQPRKHPGRTIMYLESREWGRQKCVVWVSACSSHKRVVDVL